MDYIDDLDQAALAALHELNNDFSPLNIVPDADLSAEIASLIHSTAQQNPKPLSTPPRKSNNMDYLFHLTAPITAALLSSAAILPHQPKIITGENKDGPADFVLLTSLEVEIVGAWLSSTYPNFAPIFAPLNRARKDLSPYSAYPTLGLDTTLPQNRLEGEFRPSQNEYPVFCFFYGTLANTAFLAHLFGSPAGFEPKLEPAHVFGGRLRTWGGKYRALVDCPGGRVEGLACEILTREDEDALCVYETAKYEVVRVDIEIEGRGSVKGVTFRFAGRDEELDEICHRTIRCKAWL